MITELNLERGGRRVIYRTAVYLRLSREDGDKYESDSIANQRKLIQDYIKDKNEFYMVDEYVDDGWSGSNFERPAWKKLCADLERGAVNCVIVKDLSRFGRNYIEVGRYLQMIFPMMGVRMVAINDNYDSLNDCSESDTLIVPMKNLINDVYCRDISKKVTTQLDTMRKRGECVAAFLPYGYKRNPQNRSEIIIDENTAPNVKQMFCWKLEGYSNRIIANRLNDEGVLSPYEYRAAKGEKISCCFKKHSKALWSSGSVYTVLHNEYYKGTMVQGKRRKLDYRSKEQVLLPKNEWTRTEGAHEPIVDKELFTLVQEVMEKETRIAGGGTKVELLSGFLFCGKCGRQMTLKPSYYKGKKYRYYTCKDCPKNGKKPPRISDVKARAEILNAIRRTGEIAARMETLTDKSSFKKGESRVLARLDGQIARRQEEIDRYTRIKSGLYDDYSAGILSREEYMDYSEMYKSKIDRAKEAMHSAEEERKQFVAGLGDLKWIKTFKKCRYLTSLDRPILAKLIDKVLVYEGGRLEVVFKDAKFIEAAIETCGYDERRRW